jgi:hypothetical protein
VVLFGLTAALWARSYYRVDLLGYTSAEAPGDNRQWSASLQSDGGSLFLHYSSRQNPPRGIRFPPGVTFSSHTYIPRMLRSFGPRAPLETYLGFGYRAETVPSYFVTGIDQTPVGVPAHTWRTAGFPHWLPASLAGLYPVVVLGRRIRVRRMLRCGRCPACGYDLRVTPDRCPECGLPVTQESSAVSCVSPQSSDR